MLKWTLLEIQECELDLYFASFLITKLFLQVIFNDPLNPRNEMKIVNKNLNVEWFSILSSSLKKNQLCLQYPTQLG